MIRWWPMARATSLLGGAPIYYDLSMVTDQTRVVPAYPPLFRDLETVTRSLRRKHFGTRPTAELEFEVYHSRTQNAVARWSQTGGNLLASPDDLTVAQWGKVNGTATLSPAQAPDGTYTASRLTDASGSTIMLAYQNTGQSASGKHGILTLFARGDTPHIASIGIQDNIAYALDVDVQLAAGWRRYRVDLDFPAGAANFQAMLRPTQLAVAQTGTMDVFRVSIVSGGLLPGTDEEILSDFYDKLCTDDWTVELSLDGGLTWRTVLLQDFSRVPVEEKWNAVNFRFVLECSAPIDQRPSLLDGRW